LRSPPTSSSARSAERCSACPGRFATAQAALGQYGALVYYGLPLDYYDSYVDRVDAVSVAAVASAASHQLRPEAAVYVVVGDGAQPMISRVPDPDSAKGWRDAPLMSASASARQLDLRAAITELAASGALGPGGVVELDADGCPR